MNNSTVKTICFFNSNKAWGGGEKWHFTTSREFRKRGLKTYLITNTNSALAQKCAAEGMPYFPVSISNLSFLNPFKLFKLYRYFKKQQTEAVVMNLSSDVKAGGIAAKLAGVKKIMYRRGLPHPLRNTLLNRFLYRKILTHVIVNSEEVGRSFTLHNETWFPAKKIFLLNNGVDVQAPLNPTHKLYSKQVNETIIGNAGRLTEQKGQVYLIQMAELLKAQNLKFKLLIAGEGELKETLQAQINAANLQAEVTLLGHVTDMAGFFNSLDIFVFPSLFEGSANTLIEVLHHGIPSIAFNVSSNPEIITHGQTGFLAKAFSPEELAAYVLELVNNPTLCETFTRNGQQLIREKFDIQKNLDKFQTLVCA